jgi:hypothetical protein
MMKLTDLATPYEMGPKGVNLVVMFTATQRLNVKPLVMCESEGINYIMGSEV